MPSIFTKIINNEIPGYKVAEDDKFIAILDIFPLTKGHTLVIIKREIDYIFNIEDDLYKEFLLFTKKVSKGIEKAIKCKRIGVIVEGLEVPHAHIHLIPINRGGNMNFANPKLQLTKEEFAEIAEKIREAIG
ncbi:MAG: HIT family protein [Bacteroidales bacterium]|nr:HIT family protein [Bacteroidales bacterium]